MHATGDPRGEAAVTTQAAMTVAWTSMAVGVEVKIAIGSLTVTMRYFKNHI